MMGDIKYDLRSPWMGIIPILLLLLVMLWFPVGPASAQEPTPEPVLGSIVGMVTNLTPGGNIPDGVPVVLYVLEDFDPIEAMTSTLTSTGEYAFSNVLLKEGLVYVATMDYENVAYGSDFTSYEGGDALHLDIQIYEATTDPTVISVGRLHAILEFSGASMLVSELYIFDNPGNRVYVGPGGNPGSGTLLLPLPEGAQNPGVQRSMGDSMISATSSIVTTEDGFMDTLAVRPGESAQQLMVTYEIPYDGSATVSHPLPYQVQSVTLLMPDAGLEVQSDQLADSGSVASGMPYVRWDGGNLPAGSSLTFQISGAIDQPVQTNSSMFSSDSSGQAAAFPLSVSVGDSPLTWSIGIGGLVVSLGLLAFLFFKDRHVSGRNPREDYLHAISELDREYEAGKIPAGRYELEREKLKARLRSWYSPKSN